MTTWTLGRVAFAAALLALLPALAGCGQSDPSRFYVLTSTASEGPSGESPSAREGVAIGVGPVSLPQYLDRPEIATRDSQNKLNLAEFDQWGGRLEDNFARVMAENLAVMLETDRVSIFPWKLNTPVDYQVEVNVKRFEAGPDGKIVLRARWVISGGESGEVLSMSSSGFEGAGRSDLGKPQFGTKPKNSEAPKIDYDALVGDMSRAVEALSRDIATTIRSLPQQQATRGQETDGVMPAERSGAEPENEG